MGSTLVQKREELEVKSKRLAKIFEQAGEDLDLSKVTDLEGDVQAKANEIRRLNDELTAIGKEVEQLVEVEKARTNVKGFDRFLNQPGSQIPQPTAEKKPVAEQKSIAERILESAEYKEGMRLAKPKFTISMPDVDVKVLMTTTAGFAPETTRSGLVVPFAVRRPVIASLIPSSSTSQTAIRYMEETTFTNNAAPVAEAGDKTATEAALAFTERTQPVEVIATWIPVTKQQLEDVSGIQSLITNRLTLMLQLAEEAQLVSGNGVSPQLLGFLSKPATQTQAKGADPTPDAIFKAMTKVRTVAFSDVTGIIMHPNDWQDIRLLRTVDGTYIWGSPADPGPERIWGQSVVQTTAMTENTALLGDFQMYSHISRLQGIEVAVSDQHSDFFIRNQLAIRLEERLSLEIYRAAAFCTVTGI